MNIILELFTNNLNKYYYNFIICFALFILFFVKNLFFGFNIFAVILFFVGLLIGNFFLIVDENYHIQKLPTRSLIFMLSLLPMGIFLITSTGSTLGTSTFISLLWGLSLEIYLHKDDKQYIKNRFLFQLKRDLSEDEYQKFTWFWIVISICFSLLIFI